MRGPSRFLATVTHQNAPQKVPHLPKHTDLLNLATIPIMNAMDRRSYNVVLTANGRLITEVVIDPHYEENHPDIND